MKRVLVKCYEPIAVDPDYRQPWADVWIDGEKVGETPIGNLPMAIGTHEVIFRNPDFGEQRQLVTVTLTAPARVTVDLRKKP